MLLTNNFFIDIIILSGGDKVNANLRIKELRKVLGLSQTKFGEKLGVSKSVIVNLELNRVELKEMMANLICKTYNVNPLWLTEGKGEMFFEVAEGFLDDLAIEYELTDIEKKIVSNFVKLPPDERLQVIETIKKIIT